MKFTTTFFAFIFGFVLIGFGKGNFPASFIYSEDTLRVLTWNVYLLPKPVLNGQKRRAREIARVLKKESRWDAIVLQEVFGRKHRHQIRRALRQNYPYCAGPTGKRNLMKTNGGVLIFTRNKPLNTDSIVFSGNCEGADCFAQKGAVLVELEKNGKPFQIVGTHTQAINSKTAHTIRIAQYKEILQRLLRKHEKENTPQIIAGDLNTDYGCDSCYSQMLEAFDAVDACNSNEREFTYDGESNELVPKNRSGVVREILDYILIRKHSPAMKVAGVRVQKFRAPWSRKNRDLADHYAVESEIILD